MLTLKLSQPNKTILASLKHSQVMHITVINSFGGNKDYIINKSMLFYIYGDTHFKN